MIKKFKTKRSSALANRTNRCHKQRSRFVEQLEARILMTSDGLGFGIESAFDGNPAELADLTEPLALNSAFLGHENVSPANTEDSEEDQERPSAGA